MLQLSRKEWRPIPGFRNYQISEDGDVFSLVRNKMIAQSFNWAGYKVVTITDDTGYRAPRKVHRLVYLAFVGKLIDGMVVDHKDDNKLHNHYTNLQQITPSENSTKSFISGANNDKVVWTKDFVEELCKLMMDNVPEKEMFESMGIDYESNCYNCNHLIGQLRRGEIHKDVTSKYDLSRYVPSINKKDAKLTIQQVQELYVRLLFDDETAAHLARAYGITFSSACKIRDKKTWRAVTDPIDDKLGIERSVESSTTIPWIVYDFYDDQQEYGHKLMVVGEIPLNGNAGTDLISVI